VRPRKKRSDYVGRRAGPCWPSIAADALVNQDEQSGAGNYAGKPYAFYDASIGAGHDIYTYERENA
jgi:hypothetical protein